MQFHCDFFKNYNYAMDTIIGFQSNPIRTLTTTYKKIELLTSKN